MELQEMKNVWASVDARLKENEMLNKRIVQEMLHKKSNKSLSWLVNYDVVGIVVLLVGIPLCIYAYSIHSLISAKITITVILVSIILGIIWYCYKLKSSLINIDFSKNIKDSLSHINRYNILLKREKIISYSIIIPLFSLLAIWYYYSAKMSFHSWTVLFAALIVGTVVTYWSYKRIYEKNIQSIKKSLEELEELKEE